MIKVLPNQHHLSYHKSAFTFVKVSELIGEKNLNTAIKNFIQDFSFPSKPTSLDLLNEILELTPNRLKEEVESLFIKI